MLITLCIVHVCIVKKNITDNVYIVDLEILFCLSGHMVQYVGRYSSSAESPTQDWIMLIYQTTSVKETGSANHTSAQTDCKSAS